MFVLMKPGKRWHLIGPDGRSLCGKIGEGEGWERRPQPDAGDRSCVQCAHAQRAAVRQITGLPLLSQFRSRAKR